MTMAQNCGGSGAFQQPIEIGPDREDLRQATLDGCLDRTAPTKQVIRIRLREPTSRERLGKIEFERLVDAYHRAQAQELILRQFARKIRRPGTRPPAL